jgi:uncharacterized protein
MAVLMDPEGAVFCLWQARKHRGAHIVNEPGSLNFNVLNTRDPAAARRFYGAVFGWTTLDLGSGEFWTLRARHRSRHLDWPVLTHGARALSGVSRFARPAR